MGVQIGVPTKAQRRKGKATPSGGWAERRHKRVEAGVPSSGTGTDWGFEHSLAYRDGVVGGKPRKYSDQVELGKNLTRPMIDHQ